MGRAAERGGACAAVADVQEAAAVDPHRRDIREVAQRDNGGARHHERRHGEGVRRSGAGDPHVIDLRRWGVQAPLKVGVCSADGDGGKNGDRPRRGQRERSHPRASGAQLKNRERGHRWSQPPGQDLEGAGGEPEQRGTSSSSASVIVRTPDSDGAVELSVRLAAPSEGAARVRIMQALGGLGRSGRGASQRGPSLHSGLLARYRGP